MLFTRLIVKNLYSFDNLDIDFTLKQNNNDDILNGEFIDNRPDFLVKRICIFAGANATGKTSIGRIMCALQNFLVLKTGLNRLARRISDKKQEAVIDVEFVTPDDAKLHRCHLSISKNNPPLQGIKYACVDISPKDNAEKARGKLERIWASNGKGSRSPIFNTYATNRNRLEQIEKFLKYDFHDISWTYLFSTNRDDSDSKQNKDDIFEIADKETFFNVLKSFDNTISNVSCMTSDNNQLEGFRVFFKNGDSVRVMADGEFSPPEDADRFSKGTYEAISVASFLSSMKRRNHRNFTYFMDEKMSASHAVMEKEILNIMINILPRSSQLFYTTHNSEVLDMTLPNHCFVLFRKNKTTSTEVIQPENYDLEDTIKEAVMNDIFNTLPDSYELNEYFLSGGEDDN